MCPRSMPFIGKWARNRRRAGSKVVSFGCSTRRTCSSRQTWCYQNGVGVSQDFAAAAGWFCAAANSGFAEAQFHLGVCYADGVGVLQNDMEAEKWFEKAAMQGVPAAQRLLGLCFLDGRGVSQDFTKALKWFRKAAQQDDAVAQINLASFYEHGYGIVQNSAEALMWYRRAAEQGNQKSKEHLSRFDQIKGTFIQPISGFPEPLSKVVIAPTPMRTWTIPDLGMELIPVAAGSFTMGSHTGSTDETPVRNVHITWDFWMGKTEVTQAQYRKFRGCNPSFFKGDELPVEQVSWEDARTFCEELTQHEQKAGRLPQGYVYRLPTEAEWEYAARGGNKSRGYSYSGGNVLDSVGWAFGNSDEKTHPVGHKAPNELGIYDMSGNVAEWCYGCWDNQFSQLDEIDPIALQGNDEKRLLCGGSWNCGATSCMSNCSGGEDWEKNAVGFRVVLGPSLHVDANWPGRIAPTIPLHYWSAEEESGQWA